VNSDRLVSYSATVIFGLIYVHTFATTEQHEAELHLEKAVPFSQREAIANLKSAILRSDSYIAIVPGSASDRMINYMSDPSLEKFIPRERFLTQFETAEQLQVYLTDRNYAIADGSKTVFAGVILDNMAGPDYKVRLACIHVASLTSIPS